MIIHQNGTKEKAVRVREAKRGRDGFTHSRDARRSEISIKIQSRDSKAEERDRNGQKDR